MDEKEYKKIGICNDCKNPIYEGDKTDNTPDKMYHKDCFADNIHKIIIKKQKFEEEINHIVKEIVNILINKNKGYGNSFYDGLDNVKETLKQFNDEKFNRIHYFSFYVRELDKLNRFKSLLVSSISENNKEIDIYDVVLDLAGYSILFLNYIKNYDK